MSLSYDLISEFVKITNDKKENKKEGIVYATVVGGTDGKYVQIDGSDLLTPMDTTTDIEDGERVTLMIKDHKAIITGNVTTPSASTSKVDKVTQSINSVSDRVGTFELVVADKVSTKELEAVNATIENLKVKDAQIEHAVIENLEATTADIKILNADFAQIKTLVNGNLTSDNILSFNLTSEKVTVDDAFIKDAMIDTISAGKINAGKINTNSVSIGSEDGGMLITGSTQQFTDKNGNVRIQIGKDASGDFTFILYGEDGTGQLINQNGITASAIGDGLIVNNMVSDNAAISGGKLDISSVITEINSENSTTIKSSKIYLNEQNQSLEVAFNSLKTKVDTIQEITIQGDLTAIVEQVQSNTSKIEVNKESINTLISEDTVIKKQVTDLQGTLNETETTLNSKYTSLSQNLNGFKTTVADTYATKKSVTDVANNIETNYSTTSVMNSAIEQKTQEISASVSSTYATKNEVNTLGGDIDVIEERLMSAEQKITDESITNTVKKNFYTKNETENAITSKGYATQSQVQQTADNIQFKFTQTGGYNLVRNGNPKPHNNRHWWVSGNGWWYLGNPDDIGIGTTDANEAYAGSATFKVQPNCEYSFSCWVCAEGNTKGADVYFIGSSKDDGAYEESYHLFSGGKDGWTKVEATFITGSNIQYGFIRIDNNGALNTSGYNVVFFSEVQLIRGADYYPKWSPNPNEVYDGVVVINKDGVEVSASNINGYTKMTANGFFVNNGGKDVISIDNQGLRLFDAKIQLTHANGNKYFNLDENGIIMYNPANGTHQWGKIAAINDKFTVASNGNSSGLSLGHHVNDNYIEDMLLDSYGYLTVNRQMNHNGIYHNNYGQVFIKETGQSGWEITGRSDSQSIKPGGANQGGIGSNTQYINQSWIANRYNPSSIEVKHVSHYVDDNQCISLVNGVKPARYFYKEYDEEGNDITTFSSRSSQLGLIYEDVRECSARDLITNEEDKGINLYGMVSTLWGATRNLNTRLNDAEYEIVLLKEEIEQLKNKLGKN